MTAGPGRADTTTSEHRLAEQITFLLEAERLKSVLRRSYVIDGSRHENTAEHSWTLALMAVVLAEHAAEPVDVPTVVRMVVLHDLVEIDAGDTYVYDEVNAATKAEREAAAADRIFALLPEPQAAELRATWEAFENDDTAEARFARALDRFAGFILNDVTDGRSWREHGVTADRIHARNEHIGAGAPALWDEVQRRLARAVQRGLIDTAG